MTRQGGFTWGGGRLRRWLLEGGASERQSPLKSPARAWLFDACLAFQGALPPPPPLAAPPLFILGLWRSGTTLLHEMVSGLGGFVAPTSQQCFWPASFRLAPGASRDNAVKRPMDDVMVSAGTPQEDEFALLLLGLPSLYRGILDPRRLGALQSLLNDSGDADWLEPWEYFLRNIAMGSSDRLAIKSPNHLFRLASIRKRFPHAPMLVTVRDAAQSYFSNVRTWNTLIDLHGLWAAPGGAVESFVVSCLDAGADALDHLAKARENGHPMAVCHFDALTTDPAGVTSRMLAEVGLQQGALQRAELAALADLRRNIRPHTTVAAVPNQALVAIERLQAASARLLAGVCPLR